MIKQFLFAEDSVSEEPSPPDSSRDDDAQPGPSTSSETEQHEVVGESFSKSSQETTSFVLSSEECFDLINIYFPNKHAHNYFKCHAKCSSISEEENDRIKPKKFSHDWLKRNSWWLCFVEGLGMFCLICKKHSTKNLQNKSEKFTEVPSDRFKHDAIITRNKE